MFQQDIELKLLREQLAEARQVNKTESIHRGEFLKLENEIVEKLTKMNEALRLKHEIQTTPKTSVEDKTTLKTSVENKTTLKTSVEDKTTLKTSVEDKTTLKTSVENSQVGFKTNPIVPRVEPLKFPEERSLPISSREESNDIYDKNIPKLRGVRTQVISALDGETVLAEYASSSGSSSEDEC